MNRPQNYDFHHPRRGIVAGDACAGGRAQGRPAVLSHQVVAAGQIRLLRISMAFDYGDQAVGYGVFETAEALAIQDAVGRELNGRGLSK
jgi:hypothetical protein